MQELNQSELDAVGGGLTPVEGAGLILGIGAYAVASPVVVGAVVGGLAVCMLRNLME
jgi:hypothetical protein